MRLSSDTERALEQCYDAIAVPEKWSTALDGLARSIGATACMILPHDMSDRQYGEVRSTELWKLREIWMKNCDWATPVYEPRGDPFVRRGYEALLQSHLFTDDEIRHSRYHQEIARPAGTLQWACGVFTADGRHWCMPFFRGTTPFAPDTLGPIAEISRRVARIVSISDKICRSSAEYEILALEHAGCAAMLIDRHGRVGRVNRHAESLFCSDFGVRNGKLWTAASASLSRLDRFLAMLEHSRSSGGRLPPPVIIARQGTPWLLIEAMPVTSASIEIFDGFRAVLVLTDLAQPQVADEAVLGLVFGLTKAEARLTAAICMGQDINTVAARLGVSRQTLRWQLKTVFAKTGSRRQAELVARVAQIRHAAQH